MISSFRRCIAWSPPTTTGTGPSSSSVHARQHPRHRRAGGFEARGCRGVRRRCPPATGQPRPPRRVSWDPAAARTVAETGAALGSASGMTSRGEPLPPPAAVAAPARPGASVGRGRRSRRAFAPRRRPAAAGCATALAASSSAPVVRTSCSERRRLAGPGRAASRGWVEHDQDSQRRRSPAGRRTHPVA